MHVLPTAGEMATHIIRMLDATHVFTIDAVMHWMLHAYHARLGCVMGKMRITPPKGLSQPLRADYNQNL